MDVVFKTQVPQPPRSSAAQIFAAEPGLQSQVHQGFERVADERPGIATSFAVLDAFLPWHGWPTGAMTEIMTHVIGCGELSLILPAMARLTQEKRQIICIGAPHELFAPALASAGVDPSRVTQINPIASSKKHKENLWSTEQILKTGLPGMVVLWSTIPCASEVLRRLHLAIATYAPETVFIHFRNCACMAQPSPAWLRFGFAADDAEIRLQVLKCRGRLLTRPLITLDRAAVQRRLYAQLRAEASLQLALREGLTANALEISSSDWRDAAKTHPKTAQTLQ
jgi:protein ImuA